jgi:hypothetical protein
MVEMVEMVEVVQMVEVVVKRVMVWVIRFIVSMIIEL